jgi:hypothetical protein
MRCAAQEVEIVWPRSNTRQTFRDVPLDTRIIIGEDAGEWTEERTGGLSSSR